MSADFKSLIIAKLNIMRQSEETDTGPTSKFKALAYKKAIESLNAFKGPITKIDDVKDLPGIGKKIHDKIAEIISTGELKTADKREAAAKEADILLGIHGIGPVKAKQLRSQGYTTIDTLRAGVLKDPSLLTDAQKIGLKHYEDGLLRIPRAEMMHHEYILLHSLPKHFKGEVVGSYRRGAATSGDIDILITYNKRLSASKVITAFKQMIEDMTESEYIIDVLASGNKKWMGYVRLNKDTPARRLDILVAPPAEYAYSVLYFTGSHEFNVSFRRWVLNRGYTLNEHKMTPLEDSDAPIPPYMETEEDIFKFVGLKYLPPDQRIKDVVKID